MEDDRAYRAEDDVFEDYTQEERDAMFSVPPATVWENILGFKNHPEKVAVLSQGNAFEKDLMESFVSAILNRWKLELVSRIIPANLQQVRDMKPVHVEGANSCDDRRFKALNELRFYLAKDSEEQESLFTRLSKALKAGQYDDASKLQVEMNDKMEELEAAYAHYYNNVL